MTNQATADELAIPVPGNESAARVHEALENIKNVLRGRSREECAATMGAVALMHGFYDEAIKFAKAARRFRDLVYRDDPKEHAGD